MPLFEILKGHSTRNSLPAIHSDHLTSYGTKGRRAKQADHIGYYLVALPISYAPDMDGKVICFFQAASKFGVRYATFGFQPDAKLDDGNMWAASFALIKLTSTEEAKITALVKKSVS